MAKDRSIAAFFVRRSCLARRRPASQLPRHQDFGPIDRLCHHGASMDIASRHNTPLSTIYSSTTTAPITITASEFHSRRVTSCGRFQLTHRRMGWSCMAQTPVPVGHSKCQMTARPSIMPRPRSGLCFDSGGHSPCCKATSTRSSWTTLFCSIVGELDDQQTPYLVLDPSKTACIDTVN